MPTPLVWIDDYDNVRELSIDEFSIPAILEAVHAPSTIQFSDEELEIEGDYYDVNIGSVFTVIIIQYATIDKHTITGLTKDFIQ